MKKHINIQEFRQVPNYEIHELNQKKTRYCVYISAINEGERFKIQVKKMQLYTKYADIIIIDRGSTGFICKL